MLPELKPVLFLAFQKVCKLLWGKGLGRVPGALAIYSSLSRFLWSNKPVVEVQGSKMYVNPEGLPKSYIKTFQAYIISGSWEQLTTEMFKQVVKEGDVVVDLGANLGYYTLLAARLVGEKGKVYAFEPEPINYSLLLKNIELNGYDNIVAVQKAVSNVTGKVRLFLDSKDTGAHTIYQPGNKREFIEVESVALDEFFKDKEHQINVIKMDIEGAEMAALSGMGRIIRENKNLKIFVEFYFPGIVRSGGSPERFARKLLEDYHFSIQAIGEYTKDRKYLSINTVDELLNLCKGEKTANLFLERRQVFKGDELSADWRDLQIISFGANVSKYIDELVQLETLCFDEGEAWTAENFMLDLPQKGQLSKLAISNNKLAGYMICSSPNQRKAHWHRSATHPDYRRVKVFTKLHDEFLKECVKLGIEGVDAEAPNSVIATRNFYNKRGYRRLNGSELENYLSQKGKEELITRFNNDIEGRGVYFVEVKELVKRLSK